MNISIAMCTYNGEKYIEQQLNSFLTQTILPNELVICDDCSKDKTIEILQEFSKKAKFPVRIYLNEKNLGSTKNFEKAIGLSKGDIIFCSDQDDVWHNQKIAETKKIFETSDKISLVFSNADIVNNNLDTLGYNLWESIKFNKIEKTQFKKDKAFKVLLKHNVVTGATMAFKKEFKNILFPIPKNWIHDAWIAVIISAISNIYFLDKILMKYRQHENQQIGAIKENIHISLNIALKNNRNSYLNEYKYFSYLEERLTENKENLNSYDLLLLVKDKMEHLNIRGNLPKTRIHRTLVVLKESFTKRYFNFSNGISSIFKDIIIGDKEK